MKVKEKIIREARVKKEYSQEYVASVLDISQSQYSKLENGEASFDIDKLSILIDLLELNPLDVFEFTDKQQIFLNSSYSGNINSNINNIDVEFIKKLIHEELNKNNQ
ncbi:MAG: helix-turn-helix domain-containing protein [Flavobacteriaceae bacterium]|jgi:transcriptional regulator with XRE-family HTH domain|nr:helix-turn-helix domain-containing protein [Flavobacteriaceae bacterium]